MWGEGSRVEGEAVWWGGGEGRGVEGGRTKGVNEKKKKKKIIEDIFQAEAGLLRQTMLREE